MRRFALCGMIAVSPGGVLWALPPQAESCSMCHANSKEAPLNVDGYERSAHAGLDCSACHVGSDEMPHVTPLEKVDCSSCHEGEVRGIRFSTHGRAILDRSGHSIAAACQTCHGKVHSMFPTSNADSKVSRAREVELCHSCHSDSAKTPSRIFRLKPIETYAGSVHGKAMGEGNVKAAICSDCHGSHDIRPGIDSASMVSRFRISGTCGKCHKNQSAAYSRGVHGRARAQGVKEAPTCTDCHGEHDLKAVGAFGSRVSSGAISATCSSCHGSERVVGKFGIHMDRVSSFKDSYHGLAFEGGMKKVANCASCHGRHEILPSDEPASRVHSGQLAKTCGTCHPGVGQNLGNGSVHARLSNGATQGIAGFFRSFYLVLIVLVIGGMFIHNCLRLMRCALERESLPLRREDAVLLSVSERFQHGLLVVSFMILAYTGFALEYPQAGWASLGGMLGEEGRRWIHRWAAGGLIAGGCYHAGYLSFSSAGRKRLQALRPVLRDLSDPFEVLAYNLGLRRSRALLNRFSYIEKSEYWALVWGTAVMIVTGAVLLFHNQSLTYWQLWVVEVARVVHFMEAVLACLAIVVWHFYWVMLDPEVYPMSWAWLVGSAKWKPFGRKRREP